MSENEKTIKNICESYGLSQAELSRRFEIPRRTVSDWCRGLRVPPDYVVTMIEKLLEYEAKQTPKGGNRRVRKSNDQ